MTGTNRRQFIKAAGGAGLVGMTGLSGCIGGFGGGSGGNGGSDATNIGMVYALGGLGDKSFNDMANKGIKAAKENLNISFKNAEPSGPDDFKTLQRKFAQSKSPNYELVTCVGFAQTSALQENAKAFPDQKFTIIDSVVERDNVSSIVFKEHQGSFQVGYLAGLLSSMSFSAGAGETNDQKVVGFVGGQEVPLIKKFEAGYMAGVKHADDSFEIRSAYAGTWSDPAKGKEIALSMYDEGADIVYHAAGGTGTGVFKAAAERGRYAIGVDSDQSRSAPDYADVIVASMVKHVDTAVQRTVKNVVEDSFKGGSVTSLGLSKDGVEAIIGRNFKDAIPKDVTSKLEDSRKAIVNGDIQVPEKPKNVQ